MNRDTQIFVASEVTISELKQNDIFLEIDLCLCTTNPNKNHESVTEEFIDEIVAHPEIYSCLPLYCDKAELLAGHYDRLTHRQNRLTGKFYTDQIGSLLDFRKEKTDQYSSLIATARVPKREKEICRHLINMYEQDILFFSFEVAYVLADTIVEDGTRFVDASDRNYIFGMTVVSHPAFVESVPLSLVAEDQSEATKETEGVETNMNHNTDAVAEQLEAETVEVNEAVAEQPVEQTEVTEEVNEAPATVEAVEPEESAPADEAAEEATVEPAVEPVAEEPGNDISNEGQVEAEAPVAETEAVAEETAVADMCPVCGQPEEACTCPEPTAEDAQIDAAHMAIEAEAAQLRAQIAQLEAEIESLRAEHAELEAFRAARAAQVLADRQNTARAFAEKHGLDVNNEDVAKAIAEVNYEALASIEMSQEAEAPVATDEVATAAIYDVTPSIEIKDIRAWLFENA